MPENTEIPIECILRHRDGGAYLLHEFVVMPNRLHLIVTPSVETSLEKALMLIKGGSSYAIHQQRESKIQVWASGFHESTIRDWNDYLAKVSYVRNNPVAAHLTDQPENWVYGSASGRFRMDYLPERLRKPSSGAKAPALGRPLNVGAEAPTPEKTRGEGPVSHQGRKNLANRDRTRERNVQPPEEYLQ